MRPGALETLSATARSIAPLLSRSSSGNHRNKQMPHHGKRLSRFEQENAPPLDPNVIVDPLDSPSVVKKTSTPVRAVRGSETKAELSKVEDKGSPEVDSVVKVFLRIRPVNNTEEDAHRIVRKVSPDSLMVESQLYSFNSVFGPGSTQEDVFELVGAPFVKDSLAGYNTSILCYGETGSGKTYTMWGPLSSMLEEESVKSSQGIAPRIFHMLFSDIEKCQKNSVEKQINFQCRCSFLEIYNDQISDLLDPTQRNLKIKDDARNGFYVENLSEEYVTNTDDVTQILVKGLSNRRVGATSVNSKSSRSHVVLTCIIESWCKGPSSKSFSSSKSSRITLIDLAGSERNIPDGASGRYKKESRHIKKSLSKLGEMVNGLAEVKRSGRDQKFLKSGSCLTHLLQESLGGNAKTAFICAVSPVGRHKSETLSTLRFSQKAKHVENNPVMNEITEDHVNDLSDQIRQLKEELIKEKTDDKNSGGATNGYFRRHNVRGSLNILRASLNRSLILPQIESDPEEDEDVDENDVKELYVQISQLHASLKDNRDDSSVYYSCNQSAGNEDSTLNSDFEVNSDLCIRKNKIAKHIDVSDELHMCDSSSIIIPSISSPNIKKNVSNHSVAGNCIQSSESLQLESEQLLMRKSDHVRSSLQSSKLSPTDSLAASLHRGLQIIDYHQRRPASRNSPVGFSFDYLKANSCETADKIDASIQTLPDESLPFICPSCAQTNNCKLVQQISDAQIMPSSELQNVEVCYKDPEATRIADFEKICEEQTNTINQLKRQIEKYEQQRKEEPTTLLYHDACEVTVDKTQIECPSKVYKESESFDISERNTLLEEIQRLRSQLQARSSLTGNNLLKDLASPRSMDEEYENERLRWTESESRWISLTEELRVDLESYRKLAEEKDMELSSEKLCTADLDDALQRAIIGHGKMVEHYADLQEKYSELHNQHRKVMEGIAQVKKAATKAGKKGAGYAFAQALSAELSTLRVQREKEKAFLKEQNRTLKLQLRDTAEAVHAAGELLVKLREAEEAAFIAKEKYVTSQQEIGKLRKQMEKMKKKHEMEMVTMKHYIAHSRLPESALEPIFRNEANRLEQGEPTQCDSQSWRTAFAPSYQ